MSIQKRNNTVGKSVFLKCSITKLELELKRIDIYCFNLLWHVKYKEYKNQVPESATFQLPSLGKRTAGLCTILIRYIC